MTRSKTPPKPAIGPPEDPGATPTSRTSCWPSRSSKRPLDKPEIICLCNCVSRETIEASIRHGAKTLNEIFDATCAGVGPCGGSCRRKLQPLLETYLSCGVFPDKLPEDKRGKRKC